MQRLAHELRGPAGVGAQAAQELELALAAGRPTESLLAMIRRSTKRFVRLADRLSMVSELDRGVARFERGAADVRGIVKAAATEAMEILARRKIEVAMELPEEPVRADFDARWLGAALTEICNNGIRFAKSRVVVRVTRAGDEVTIAIEDDGPGFNEGGPFQSAAPHASGLGLSLGLARDVVAAHGGRIVFGRGAAAGAAVTITLPQSVSPRAAR
jgi:signal transduction histidine kinase